MPSTYRKTGKSHTKEYKAEYMREWREKPENKERVIANNARYFEKKLKQLQEKSLSDNLPTL